MPHLPLLRRALSTGPRHRALVEAAVEQSLQAGISPLALTVNSSPWAVEVHMRLGFVPTGPLVEHKDIRAVPLAWRGAHAHRGE